MEIKELAKKYKQYVIDMRREFHMYPEPSMREVRTSKRVKEELDKMGIPYITAGGTGVIAAIKGKNSGKTVALRADMDALEIWEENEVEYKSKNEGIMHACGHDGHTAMLLGAAKILNDIKDEIKGTVKLFFQPGEEVAKGAKAMIAEGAMDGVDGIFGIHLWADIECGKVSVEAGPRMASADMFKIIVKGKGGHGSAPHQTIDPIAAASAIVMNLQSIVSREMNPMEPVVITVGSFHSGSRFNVIPGEAELIGTTRCYNNEIQNSLPSIIERIAKTTAESYRAEAIVEYTCLLSPTINDPECSSLAERSVEKILGKDGLVKCEKVTGGEDISEFMKLAPGAIAFVGIGNKEKGIAYPHHHPKFNMDEDGLEVASALYAQYAVDFLNK